MPPPTSTAMGPSHWQEILRCLQSVPGQTNHTVLTAVHPTCRPQTQFLLAGGLWPGFLKGRLPALWAEASPGWKLRTRRRPEWVRALPAQAPHQHQAVLAAREEVAAVPCELQAGDVLVVAAQDDQEVPCGDLGKAGHTQVRAGRRVQCWAPQLAGY